MWCACVSTLLASLKYRTPTLWKIILKYIYFADHFNFLPAVIGLQICDVALAYVALLIGNLVTLLLHLITVFAPYNSKHFYFPYNFKLNKKHSSCCKYCLYECYDIDPTSSLEVIEIYYYLIKCLQRLPSKLHNDVTHFCYVDPFLLP